MGEDPRIPAIRRAFEEAHFDERTPDEKGFADVFESFKPKLIEGIERNLRAVAGRRFGLLRKGLLGMGCVTAIVVVNVVAFATQNSDLTGKTAFIVMLVAGAAFFSIPLWSKQFTAIMDFFDIGWVAGQRRDPNQWPMLEAVLAQFGSKLGVLWSARERAARSAPIRPQSNSIFWIHSATIEGVFDGHLKFSAARVTAWQTREQKKTVSFHGWHVMVDLPFSFNGTTTVRDREAPAAYEDGLKLIPLTLEDPDFSRRFIAQTDDQVEARIIFAPDVIHHFASFADRVDRGEGNFMMAFSGSKVHIWLPWRDSALSDWQPLHPPKLIQDLHEAFAEMAEIRAFLRDIDAIAESEGFRAQAARNARTA